MATLKIGENVNFGWPIFFFFLFFFQNWFAFTDNGSQFNFTKSGEVDFPNSGNPTADDNYGFCQVYVSPIVKNQVHNHTMAEMCSP